jgi:endonuclease/exonuclease/phosphatase family metal-dependent hydrolase
VRFATLALGALLPYVLPSSAAVGRDITVSTFNIAWYGLGGNPDNSPADETRDASLKSFIRRHLADSDVIAFQEIVDVERLVAQVLDNARNCYSYRNRDPKHQHVVICVKPELRFEPITADNNFTIESVALGYLRPAVHGVIKSRDGRRLMYLAAVHLKANPESADVRREQIQKLGEYIRRNVRGIPVAIVGDFNTHGDDSIVFQDIFSDLNLPVEEIENRFDYTYNDSQNQQKLDRIWVSRRVVETSSPRVFGPCNTSPDTQSNQAIRHYLRTISDHCPVKTTIDTSVEID